MDTIVEFFVDLQFIIAKIAGFGVSDSYSAASVALLIAMALFATACIGHLAERTSLAHLSFNFIALFGAGVAGNALLRGVHLPLGHELLVTATLTLIGMTTMAFALLYTYRRTDL